MISVNGTILRADDPITAPAGDFTPASTNAYDLGVTGTRWRRVYLSGYAVSPSIGPTAAQQHTLPAVTSDTIALLAAAQTLTNKTLTAPSFGNGASVETGTAATTDATVTTVWSKTLADNTVYDLDITLVGRRTNPAVAGTAEYAIFRRRVAYSRDNAGAATIIGTAETIATDRESTGGYDITIDASTNDVRVRATGATSHNITWTCTVHIHSAAT